MSLGYTWHRQVTRARHLPGRHGPTVWCLVACVLGVCSSVSASWSSVMSWPCGQGCVGDQGRRAPVRGVPERGPCRRRCPFLVGDPAAEEWSPWSVCSLTCGQGLQVRTRSCVSSPYGTLCSGPLRETRACNNSATCPGTPVLTTCLGLGLTSQSARSPIPLHSTHLMSPIHSLT